MRQFSLLMLAMVMATTTASAGSGRYRATLAQSLGKKTELIIEDNAWLCDGSTCTLTSEPRNAYSVRTCAKLRRAVGVLTAYGTEGMQFDAAKLEECNARG